MVQDLRRDFFKFRVCWKSAKYSVLAGLLTMNSRNSRVNFSTALRYCGGNMSRGSFALGGALAICFAVLPRLRRAKFFYAAMTALAAPGFAQTAAGLCPVDGSRRGTVVSVNERLELTLADGLCL